MPSRPSKDVVQKIVELPTVFAEEVSGFAQKRGETFRAVVMCALRRHMDSPPPMPAPPPAPPPLPPMEATAPKPAGKKKKKSADAP